MKETEKEKLCRQLHLLTKIVCKATCKNMGMCCESTHCEQAYLYADSLGVGLEVKDEYWFLKDNQCTMPPQFRTTCILHQCQIASLGFFQAPFYYLTELYFELRDNLDKILQVEWNEESM